MERKTIDVVSIASARLKFGIQGTRMKSRTYPRTARSHAFPSVPARSAAPQSVSLRGAFFCRRKTKATRGAATSVTATQTRDGKSPQAMPWFVASWNRSTCGITVVVSP